MFKSRLRPTATALILAIVTTVLVACTADGPPPEQVAAQRFLDALGSRAVAKAAAATTDPPAATTSIEESLAGLGDGASGTFKVSGSETGESESATASYTASWAIPGVAKRWTYRGSLALVQKDDAWLVTWSPKAVNPKLGAAEHLRLTRTQPSRAQLQDSSGAPIFTGTPVVVVGITPSKVTDLGALSKQLAQTLNISAADIVTSVQSAKPGDFVTVITLRADYYASVKDAIHDLPGTIFRTEVQVLPPASGWGQPWLGSVGPATKEIIDASAGRIAAGDVTGLSGLQRTYDKQLSGSTGIEVYAAADADGQPGTRLATLVAPKAGTAVKLTIDRPAQSAAEAALETITAPASVVALRPSTGEILALANSSAATSDIAASGQFPAGSDFKIVTYAAAFAADPQLSPTATAGCPGTITVDGREFENQDQFDKGTVTVRDAFAYSCNTTAIAQAMKLPADALPKAATRLGIGSIWDLPIDAFSGSLPTPTTPTEQAANAIGQGSVLVSPLAMASVAGAAASGTPVAPSLLAGQPSAPGTALDKKVTADLNTLMRAVVQQPFGTAHALAGLPGAVQGKTGTAEFGTDNPPRSHSWMVGTRGDLAFAVFVYGGESSHDTAVPLAAKFLTAYP